MTTYLMLLIAFIAGLGMGFYIRGSIEPYWE